MTQPIGLDVEVTTTTGGPPVAAARPPGDRYFRHPGDVVRLVLAAAVLLLLVLFVELATETSRGVSADLGRAATAVPDAAREFLLALTQIVAIAFPVLVVGAIVARQRWRRLGVVVLAAGAARPIRAARCRLRHRWLRARGDRRHLGAPTDFPSLVHVAGASAVVTAGSRGCPVRGAGAPISACSSSRSCWPSPGRPASELMVAVAAA
jgi:hypothetical protein